MDGNFGLVRKKSAGKDVSQAPRFTNPIFEDQTQIDKFVASHDNSKKKQVTYVCIVF